MFQGNVRNFNCPITTRFLGARWRKKNFYARERQGTYLYAHSDTKNVAESRTASKT